VTAADAVTHHTASWTIATDLGLPEAAEIRALLGRDP
jgi:hypothetical protein